MAKRDENGRFVAGESGNPKGRPPKEREERYLEITLSAVTFDDWKSIVKKAADQAKRGDSVARKWLSDYLIGPPTQRTELTGADGGAVEVKAFEFTDDEKQRAMAKLYEKVASRADADGWVDAEGIGNPAPDCTE